MCLRSASSATFVSFSNLRGTEAAEAHVAKLQAEAGAAAAAAEAELVAAKEASKAALQEALADAAKEHEQRALRALAVGGWREVIVGGRIVLDSRDGDVKDHGSEAPGPHCRGQEKERGPIPKRVRRLY